MQKIISVIVSIIFLCHISCDDKPSICGMSLLDDQITFGHFYGECVGEGCIAIFRIDQNNKRLLEDSNDNYVSALEFYEGNFTIEYPDEKYQLVKDLVNYFPERLLTESGNVIGQPDGGDWGGIYFEVNDGVLHRFWLLDQKEENMPKEYNDFVDKIKEKIAIIY